MSKRPGALTGKVLVRRLVEFRSQVPTSARDPGVADISALLAVLCSTHKQQRRKHVHFEKQNGYTADNRFRDARRRRPDLATASAVRRRNRIRFGDGSAAGSVRPLEGGNHRKVAVVASGEEAEGGVIIKTR